MPAYLTEEQPTLRSLEELAALDDGVPMEEPEDAEAGFAGEGDEFLEEDEELVAW